MTNTYAFVPSLPTLSQVNLLTAALTAQGVDPARIRVGPSFDDFVDALPAESTLVVYSVDFFPSLTELLTAFERLSERGIVLHSIAEPWLSARPSSTADLLIHLRHLANKIHTARTRQGLLKAQQAGKRLGRPAAKARKATAKNDKL